MTNKRALPVVTHARMHGADVNIYLYARIHFHVKHRSKNRRFIHRTFFWPHNQKQMIGQLKNQTEEIFRPVLSYNFNKKGETK